MLRYHDKTAVELSKEPEPKNLKLKNRNCYLEILKAAAAKLATSAAEQ
jgi:hypothetical protein